MRQVESADFLIWQSKGSIVKIYRYIFKVKAYYFFHEPVAQLGQRGKNDCFRKPPITYARYGESCRSGVRIRTKRIESPPRLVFIRYVYITLKILIYHAKTLS